MSTSPSATRDCGCQMTSRRPSSPFCADCAPDRPHRCDCHPTGRSTRNEPYRRWSPPASRMRCTTVARYREGSLRALRHPFIIGTPASMMLSFSTTVLPFSFPLGRAFDHGFDVPGIVPVLVPPADDSPACADISPPAGCPVFLVPPRCTRRRSGCIKLMDDFFTSAPVSDKPYLGGDGYGVDLVLELEQPWDAPLIVCR